MKFKQVLLVALLASTGFSAFAADGNENLISPQDKLLLKVLEWLPAKGEYREWNAVGGEYTVSVGNTILVPFVGEVSTANRSPSALSAAVAASLQRDLSLPGKPEVSAEFVARSPVYILGGVETPGKVDFTPGLTAIEAIALSGGFYRGAGGSLRLERDTINAEGDISAAQDQADRLTARIARLEAELADRRTVVVDGRQGPLAPPLDRFVAEEQKIMEIRRQGRLSKLGSLTSRQKLAADQLATFREKSANLDRQIDLAKKQLGGVQTLVQKGLTANGRAFELERTLADLEGQRLDLELGSLAANLEINEADRNKVDLVTEFQGEVAAEIQTSRMDLAKADVEIDRGRSLLHEATVIAPEKLMDRAGNLQVGIKIFLTRTVGGNPSTIEIGKDERLQAGDTVQVQMDIDETPRNNRAAELQ